MLYNYLAYPEKINAYINMYVYVTVIVINRCLHKFIDNFVRLIYECNKCLKTLEHLLMFCTLKHLSCTLNFLKSSVVC